MATSTTTPQTCPNCLTGPLHPGTPTGTTTTTTLGPTPAYRTGTHPRRAILLLPDLLGWTYPNTRLLADAYAAAVPATVVVPDLFGGEELPRAPIDAGRWDEVDVPGFLARHGRGSEVPRLAEGVVRALPEAGFVEIGAVGFCFGAWVALHLAGVPGLGVGVVSVGHPSLVTPEDFARLPPGACVQVLAAERDPVFTAELKRAAFEALLGANMVFDYQNFPGVEHGCLVRGDPGREREREAMERGCRAVVAWLREHLGGHDEGGE